MTAQDYSSPELFVLYAIESDIICTSDFTAPYPDGWVDENEWE